MQLRLQACTIVATKAAEVGNNAIDLIIADDPILRSEVNALPSAPR
jgi:hypothetical protein